MNNTIQQAIDPDESADNFTKKWGENGVPSLLANFLLKEQHISGAMWDIGRSAVMARDCSSKTWSPEQHFNASGISKRGLESGDYVGYHSIIPKEQGASLVYKMMVAHMPLLYGSHHGISYIDLSNSVADPELFADAFIETANFYPSLQWDKTELVRFFEAAFAAARRSAVDNEVRTTRPSFVWGDADIAEGDAIKKIAPPEDLGEECCANG